MTAPNDRAVTAGRWTATAMLLRAALGVVQLVALSRILEQHELGQLAIVVSIQSLSAIAAELGLGNALIHFRDISDRQRSTVYWLALAMALLAGGLVALSSGAIASFYGEPELAMVLIAISPYFLLVAIGQQFRVLAEKTLNFRPVALIEIAAAIVGTIVGVASALGGLGTYAVVTGSLASAATASVLAWSLLSNRWVPALVFDPDAAGRFLRYGSHVTALGFCNAIGQQGDILVAGRLFSSAALGAYFPMREIGMRGMMIINPIVTRVSLPMIAESQGNNTAVAALYAKTMLITASVYFPMYAALGLFAPQVVGLLFGPQWSASVPLLQAVALWCAFRAIGNPVGSLLLATGNTGRALISSALVTALVFLSAWGGAALLGPIGAPLALAGLYAILIPWFWWFLVRPVCGLRLGDYFASLARPAACTLLAMPFAMGSAAVAGNGLTSLIAGLLAGGLAYGATSRWFNRVWWDAALHFFKLPSTRTAQT